MASSAPAPESVNARRAQMFPVLSELQIARIARLGHERRFDAGALLFDDGDAGVPLFVVLEGELEIVHPSGAEEELVVVHGAGQFTGEISLISGTRALVRGRSRTATRVVALEPAQFRSLIQSDSELSEIFMRAFILRRVGLFEGHQGDAVVLGSRHSGETMRLQAFLTRNGHPYRYVDVDLDGDVQSMLDHFKIGVGDVPVLICRNERILKNPSNAEVAECLGFNAAIDHDRIFDVIVVGAGPAGLAAAVYGASEGLDVLVVESTAPGGQAGTSSKIENYLGFPTGISGQALAQRALAQAAKFGAQIAVAKSATRLHCDKLPYRLELEGGEMVAARVVIIASGAEYQKLDVPDLKRFEGNGVYYGATFIEAQRCEADEVIVAGGGNSAGQAASYLAQTARHVHMLVRGPGLAASMSRYLIRRIEQAPNITLRTRTQIVALAGADQLEEVTWLDESTGERVRKPIRHVFSMVGARPNTDWLHGCLATDDKGFVLTGRDLESPAGIARSRKPRYQFETSLKNVFAVGDVRSGSMKRVASGVGEGSACIQIVHRVLAE